jgi:glycerophosphoryl diester phosphodiesterase
VRNILVIFSPFYCRRFALAQLSGAEYRGDMPHTFEIVAHRGASFDAPENTVASTRLGWQQQADAVETDVHLTRDGKLVCLHDSNTRRTTGVDAEIADVSLAELQKLDAGKWKDPQFAGERIPTLEQLLATVPSGKRFVVEIKCKGDITAELRATLLRTHFGFERIVLISFDARVLQTTASALPGCMSLLLASHQVDEKTGAELPSLDELIEQARRAGFDGLNLNQGWPVDSSFVKKLKTARLKLYIWTVNDPMAARQFIDAGVDGITTDRPAWLRAELKRMR